MNLKYENGALQFNLSELFDQMSPEDKKSLVERLSCDSDIIEHVASQIATGYTENCCSGSTSCGCEQEPQTPLDKARRKLALSANDVAKAELQSALRSLQSQQAWSDYYKGWALAMYHAWGKQSACPDLERPKCDAWCDYEVVKKQKAEPA